MVYYISEHKAFIAVFQTEPKHTHFNIDIDKSWKLHEFTVLGGATVLVITL